MAQGKGKGGRKEENEKVVDLLDKLLDITTCPHTILLCNEEGSGCMDIKKAILETSPYWYGLKERTLRP